MIKFGKKGVKVSPLFCDKLAFVIQYKTMAECNHVRQRLKILKEDSQGHYARPWGTGKYKIGMKFFIGQHEQVDTMLVQADPKTDAKHFVRVEYNPAHADTGTVFWLLNQILPGGWLDIPTLGKCTRFDATVDVAGIDIMELLVYYPGLQISRLFCKGGRFETMDLGRSDGDKRVLVYDKCAEIKHYNEEHQIKLAVPPYPVTRIEIVLRPALMFGPLADINNPFLGLNVYAVPPLSSADTLEFKLFVKVAQLGGLQQAFLGLPDGTRKQFKAIMEKSATSWWDPNAIWATWPGLLFELLQLPHPVIAPAAAIATATAEAGA
jgi:hypothetical protein